MLPALADTSDTCSGKGDNDYVVAQITAGGVAVSLKGYGNFHNSTVYVTVDYKKSNGETGSKSQWLNINNGSGHHLLDSFKLPSGTKLTSITVSNPKCS